jgi:hypothetical protein
MRAPAWVLLAFSCAVSLACQPCECHGDVCTNCSGTTPAAPAPTIRASDYDTGCTTSNDCTAILEGALCVTCACPNAAIAKSSATIEFADARQRATQCPATPSVSCGACWESRPTCVAGRCGLVMCMNGPCDDGSAPSEAGVADATATEDSPDAGACRATIDAYCASDASSCPDCRCVSDWSTAKDPSQWCSSNRGARVFVYPQCDGFHLVVLGYADTSTFYYYDPVTLKLVRVENHGNGGAFCVAGQAGPVVPLTDCLDGALPTSICERDSAAE